MEEYVDRTLAYKSIASARTALRSESLEEGEALGDQLPLPFEFVKKLVDWARGRDDDVTNSTEFAEKYAQLAAVAWAFDRKNVDSAPRVSNVVSFRNVMQWEIRKLAGFSKQSREEKLASRKPRAPLASLENLYNAVIAPLPPIIYAALTGREKYSSIAEIPVVEYRDLQRSGFEWKEPEVLPSRENPLEIVWRFVRKPGSLEAQNEQLREQLAQAERATAAAIRKKATAVAPAAAAAAAAPATRIAPIIPINPQPPAAGIPPDEDVADTRARPAALVNVSADILKKRRELTYHGKDNDFMQGGFADKFEKGEYRARFTPHEMGKAAKLTYLESEPSVSNLLKTKTKLAAGIETKLFNLMPIELETGAKFEEFDIVVQQVLNTLLRMFKDQDMFLDTKLWKGFTVDDAEDKEEVLEKQKNILNACRGNYTEKTQPNIDPMVAKRFAMGDAFESPRKKKVKQGEEEVDVEEEVFEPRRFHGVGRLFVYKQDSSDKTGMTPQELVGMLWLKDFSKTMYNTFLEMRSTEGTGTQEIPPYAPQSAALDGKTCLFAQVCTVRNSGDGDFNPQLTAALMTIGGIVFGRGFTSIICNVPPSLPCEPRRTFESEELEFGPRWDYWRREAVRYGPRLIPDMDYVLTMEEGSGFQRAFDMRLNHREVPVKQLYHYSEEQASIVKKADYVFSNPPPFYAFIKSTFALEDYAYWWDEDWVFNIKYYRPKEVNEDPFLNAQGALNARELDVAAKPESKFAPKSREGTSEFVWYYSGERGIYTTYKTAESQYRTFDNNEQTEPGFLTKNDRAAFDRLPQITTHPERNFTLSPRMLLYLMVRALPTLRDAVGIVETISRLPTTSRIGVPKLFSKLVEPIPQAEAQMAPKGGGIRGGEYEAVSTVSEGRESSLTRLLRGVADMDAGSGLWTMDTKNIRRLFRPGLRDTMPEVELEGGEDRRELIPPEIEIVY